MAKVVKNSVHWARQQGHIRTLSRFLVVGGLTTVVGLLLIILFVKLGMEANLANLSQATLVFGASYWFYRRWVFGDGKASNKAGFSRWLLIKIAATFLVTPIVFFVSHENGLIYWASNLIATAVSAAFSFLAGYWAFEQTFIGRIRSSR